MTPDNYTAEDNEYEEQVLSPTNVCKLCNSNFSFVCDFVFAVNVQSTADDFTFNEQDELEPTTSWNAPRSDSVLEPISPSEYLKHQKQAIIAYVDVNTMAVEDETHL